MAFIVNQVVTNIMQYQYGTSSTFTSAVTAGDFLYIILSSSSYAATAGSVTAVSDNINGAWTILDNSGSVASETYYNFTGAFAYCVNSAAAAANALTVNATISGQNFDSILVDLSGAATSSPIVGHSINSNTSVSGSGTTYNFVTPSVIDASSGDFVIGWSSAFAGWGPVTAGTGATLDSSYAGSSYGQAAALHLTASSTSGSNSVSGVQTNAGSIVTGTVIVSQPQSAAGGGFSSSWSQW